jgi:hypothetical protein
MRIRPSLTRPSVGFFVDDEMLAMGAALQEAKQVCKENGKLFEDWCGSGECPVGVPTAQRLMAIHRELGGKNPHVGVFNNGFAEKMSHGSFLTMVSRY